MSNSPKSVKVLQRPELEPVSLGDAKRHLRLTVDQTDDDLYILAIIATARRLIERRLGTSLMRQQLRATWAASEETLEIPYSPLYNEAEYEPLVEADGVEVDDGDYTVDTDSKPSLIVFDPVPSGVLFVTYWAGVATTNEIPPQLRTAILLFVGHLYAHREAVSEDGASELPMAVEMLLASESITGAY